MELTKHQQREKAALIRLKDAMGNANDAYYRRLRQHKCVAVQVGMSAGCAICDNDMGWWCPKSPHGTCRYPMTTDECKYCGEPDERK
jgi:hypothetical protein